MKRIVFLLSIVISLIPSLSFAQGLFGPEWTFTNEEIVAAFSAGSENRDEFYIEKWIEKIREKCPSCEISEISMSRSRISFGETFWFEIGVDPAVLEVTAKPMTLEEVKANESLIQSLVFDSAFEVGLTPHRRLGGGHIHLDIETHFNHNELVFRNFVVDLFNSPELFMGALSHDYLNAPPTEVLERVVSDAIAAALFELDLGVINLEELTDRILDAYKKGNRMSDFAKYHAVNLSHTRTLEIRGFRPQTSARHYIADLEILDRRIRLLENLTYPLKYTPKDYSNSFSYEVSANLHTYTTHLEPEVILKSFAEYLAEIGLKLSDYAEWLADERLEVAAATMFENESQSLPGQRHRPDSCKMIFFRKN